MERMNTLFRKIMAIVFLSMTVMPVMAQTTLTFMGKDANGQPVQLDSVRVSNLSRGWTEVLDASDLTLTMTNSGVEQHDLQPVLSQNVPNPFNGITDFSVQLKKSGMVNIAIFTLKGEKVAHLSQNLGAGCHTYRIQLSKPQTYLLNVQIGKESSSIKMVNTGNAGVDRIHYVGNGELETGLLKSGRGSTDELFVLGDTLSFIGFSTIAGAVCTSMTVTKQMLSSQTIELQFTEADVFVCGTSLVFDYDGNVYNTVQIGAQCWMKENVRATHFADGTPIPIATTNSTTNAYCCYPNNDASTVPTYGLLYNWPAVMQMDFNSGESDIQGICPDGWHVPCEQEWYTLLYYMMGQSNLQCDNQPGNIGKALASTSGWQFCGGNCTVGNDLSTNNASGFSAMPAGVYEGYYDDESFGYEAFYWSSSQSLYNNMAAIEYLMYDRASLSHWNYGWQNFLSVRCLRNETDSVHSGGQPCPQHPTVTDYDGNVYNTVQIGTQCWMKENLKTSHYADGTYIPTADTLSDSISYRYFPEGDSSNVSTYGCLYNWAAVMNGDSSSTAVPSNVQGVCPTGWHIPSAAEWIVMQNYVGTQNDCQCGHRSDLIAKALSSTTEWESSTIYCSPGYLPMYNNASGFSALPAGYYYGGGYSVLGREAFFWSTTEVGVNVAAYRNIQNDFANFQEVGTSNYVGLSVRCLKD